MSAAPGARPPVSAEPATPGAAGDERRPAGLLLTPPRARPPWQVGPARVLAMCAVELQKLRHDRTELYTRAVQPALWLVIFGETFTRIRAIPTGGIPYIDYLAPGIIAQSAMFIAIFYGIMIIWERDSGILTKLLVTPTPRAALVTGKAFAAGVKAVIQAVVVVVIAALLGVALTWNPLRLLGVAGVVVLGSAFFSCLSMTIAGIVLTRDRLMGIGQAITMPLFFGSNALYPVAVMPGWLQAISRFNPLSYEVDALRGLLLGTPAHLGADAGVLAPGFRTFNYTYIGSELTWPIYWKGTLGRAKADLDRKAEAIRERLGPDAARVVALKAVVTQASSAIPVVPLYGTVLFKVMKQLGLHEGCIEQIDRLLRTRLGKDAPLDEAQRLRVDDWELSPEVQTEVLRRWPLLSTETLGELADLAEYRSQFLRLFGFGIDGVDYMQDVDPRVVPE